MISQLSFCGCTTKIMRSTFDTFPIGTFSTKTNTWMWAWNNSTSEERSKNQVLVVKDFGEKEGFEKLSSGHFLSDEFDGWEFIAICMRFLGGIGGYRVSNDHLEHYLLLMEQVSSERAKKLEDQLIECDVHGKIRHAFVCQHLSKTKVTGFVEAFETHPDMPLGDEDDFQAWCHACEDIRVKHNGWNDESMEFAKIKLVCEKCYFEMKAFNSSQQFPN